MANTPGGQAASSGNGSPPRAVRPLAGGLGPAVVPIAAPPARQRVLIRQMEPSVAVEGVFAIQNAQLSAAKDGNAYIRCLVADRSGRAPARMWRVSESFFRTLPTDGFVWLRGETQRYQGELQIVIKEIEPAQPSPDELLDLLPCSKHDREEMFAELSDRLRSLADPGVKCLAAAYVDDADLMERFKRAPAAMSLHHAFISGLLAHTLS